MYNPFMPEWVGQTLGKVRIEKYLASGGMAEVYVGTHLTLDRPVAIKVLHGHIKSNPTLQSRFEREARAIATLRHPNIVQILDFDTYNDHPYIVMEYIKGPALSTYLRTMQDHNITIPLNQIGHLLGSIATGLDYAHAQGIIHRDIKPANILLHSLHGEVTVNSSLTNEIEPVLTDFGLARVTHSVTQTESGVVSGTPVYMSPEQARGLKVDHRSDLYSLGVMLYEMLAGRVPFEGESTVTVILKVINEPPPPIENISPELQSIIDKALAKEPDHRYQSARALAMDFFEAVDMHAEAGTIHELSLPQTNRLPSAGIKPKRSMLWIGTGILACICGSIIFASTLGLSTWALSPDWKIGRGNPAEILPAAALTEEAQTNNPAVGVFRFQDGTGNLDQIMISSALKKSAPDTQYEAWLISEDGTERRSLGILTPDAAGKLALTYTDAQSRNLLDGYNRMEITIERTPDDNPKPSGNAIYSSGIPGESLVHIRHLLVAYEGAPGKTALAIGLLNTTELIKKHADQMVSNYEENDATRARIQAEAILNMIHGSQNAEFYRDWDGNNKLLDPGDGFGLLPNGDQEGYIDDTITYAKLAAEAVDATNDIRMHSEHTVISLQNVEGWATQLSDILIRIVQAEAGDDMEADVHAASALADQLLGGIDINGNKSIDPIDGEGGAMSAYLHAEYMADMPILLGTDQTP
jgi:serine/threonine protein kinase